MHTTENRTVCRVCGSKSVAVVAPYQPYADYATTVLDCHACGCRFVAHDPRAHELLHAHPSTYDAHAAAAATAEQHFREGNPSRLRAFLGEIEKNRFVIRFVDEHPEIRKIAEIGCSRGHLASYFIATGRELYGFDVSPTAVGEAERAFGKHFHLMSEATLRRFAEFDAIFHVGTIGCVEKPIEFTRLLLSALKPGGWLLFNAPVREHLDRTGALWLNTPPPDLVTVFPLRFWNERFAADATVHAAPSYCSAYEAFAARRKARMPAVTQDALVGAAPPSSRSTPRWRRLARATLETASRPFSSGLVRPYGAFIVLQKKS